MGGGANPRGGGQHIIFAKIFEKLHEIEKILGRWRGGGAWAATGVNKTSSVCKRTKPIARQERSDWKVQ